MKAKRKNPHAQALGRLGGLARSQSLGPKKVRAIAIKAARARTKKLSAAKRKEIASLGGRAKALKRKQQLKKRKEQNVHDNKT